MKVTKNVQKLILVLATSAIVSGAMAESLTIPNSFTAGSAAVAAEVNDNFAAVETAVDDNDSRITTNTGNVSTNSTNIGILDSAVDDNDSRITTNTGNISTNSTNIGILDSAVIGINTAVADLESAQSGDTWIAVNAKAFVSNVDSIQKATECVVNNGNTIFGVAFLNIGTATSDCGLIGGVSLPHNSTVKEIRCSQRPAATGAGIVLASSRNQGDTAPITHVGIAAPATSNSNVQTSVSTGIFQPVVNNETNTYYLVVSVVSPDFSGAGPGSNWGFYGCSVRVTPTQL